MFDITPMEVDLEQHREIHLLMLLPKVKLVKQYKVDIKIAKLPLLKKYKNLYLKKELIRFFILNNIDQRVSTSEVIKIRSLLFLKNSFQKYWLLDNFYYRMLFLLKKYERSEFLLRQAQAVNKPRPRRAHRVRTRCASTIQLSEQQVSKQRISKQRISGNFFLGVLFLGH